MAAIQSRIDQIQHPELLPFGVESLCFQPFTYHLKHFAAAGIPVNGALKLGAQVFHILLGTDILFMLHFGRTAVGSQSQHIPCY